MPWMETSLMDQRVQFIADYTRALWPVSELCRRYGVSRKTAYKWLTRYDADGPAGLTDRSRRPHHRRRLLAGNGRRRRRAARATGQRTLSQGPNDVWTADFKGEFRTDDGHYCYPLTILDDATRFLLACQALPAPTTGATRRTFAHLFRTIGIQLDPDTLCPQLNEKTQQTNIPGIYMAGSLTAGDKISEIAIPPSRCAGDRRRKR